MGHNTPLMFIVSSVLGACEKDGESERGVGVQVVHNVHSHSRKSREIHIKFNQNYFFLYMNKKLINNIKN